MKARISQRQRLSVVLGLNVVMIAGAVIVGLTTHSLGVLAAGGDYVADSIAILLGIIAVTIRDRAGGRSRAPTIVALVNASALLVVTVVVLIEAVQRLIHGTPEINGLPVLIVSAVGAVVMMAGALVLGSDAGHEDLHMRSVLLDTLSDALTSAAVAVAGGIMYFAQGLYWLDSVLAILIELGVGAGAVGLLRDVVRAVRTPAGPEAPSQMRRELTAASSLAPPRVGTPAAATGTSDTTAPSGADSFSGAGRVLPSSREETQPRRASRTS